MDFLMETRTDSQTDFQTATLMVMNLVNRRVKCSAIRWAKQTGCLMDYLMDYRKDLPMDFLMGCLKDYLKDSQKGFPQRG